MTDDRTASGSRAAAAEALSRSGLVLRGGFDFEPGEPAPPGPSGDAAGSILLVGSAGAAFWPRFCAWRAGQPPGQKDPLDGWSRLVLDDVARRLGARAIYPFERPYWPFQSWAMRAEGLKPSPLGILMHPLYGLWHAYRGALLFGGRHGAGEDGAARPAGDASAHPCDGCAEKPCLGACPVAAHGSGGFRHADCLAHVRSAAGEACRSRGCLDRNACPVGREYRYPEALQAFHMRAFARL